MGLFSAVKNKVKSFPPAYFTLAMATGIVSIGAQLLDFSLLSDVLFWGNNVLYGSLLLILLARMLFFFKSFASDFTSFKKGPGFFSLVAATGILGIQFAQLKQFYTPAIILFWFGVILWVVLIYSFFLVITTESDKPSLEKGINGMWLLPVVAIQSIAILGTSLAKHLPFPPEQVLFFTLSAFFLGLVLYVMLITLIFYRLTFFPTTPKEVTPPYWINEGAVGITALAGATFIQTISNATGFTDFIPFIKGVSVLALATATWWIPIIVLLEGWKYLIKKVPLSYTPKYWSLVFCLGGYAVAAYKLSQAIGAPYLQPIPKIFFYVSLALWGLVFLGMLFSLVKTLTSATSDNQG